MLLVDVARGLFARKGLEQTTMADIAAASGKGRRTLYTYFRNIEAVRMAVVEGELGRISKRLEEVASKPLPPEVRLMQLIYAHLSLAREAVMRNGTLRADFFRDIWAVEKVRRQFDNTERTLLARILMEGVRSGVFDVLNVRLTVEIIHYSLKGLEVPYIYGRLGQGGPSASRPLVERIIMGAIGKAHN